MIMSVLRLAGMAGILCVFVVWIVSLVQFDGRCEEDCDDCLFPEQCPFRERKEEEEL